MSESGGSNYHPMDEAIREQENENTLEDDLVRGASAALGIPEAAAHRPRVLLYPAHRRQPQRTYHPSTVRSIITRDTMFQAAVLRADSNRMRKSSSEPPSECKQLMDRLKKCSRIQLLEELSRISTWTFGKCELGHWKEILAIFDTILEEATFTSPNNKWQLTCDSYDSSDKKLLLWILHFTTLLIEHSFSRHTYKSMDRLLALLTSSDMSVVLGVLNLLYMFSKRSNFITRMQCEQRVALIHRLHYLAESWGGKENGFGLADCCNSKKSMPPSGTTLHFEFHNDQSTTTTNTDKNSPPAAAATTSAASTSTTSSAGPAASSSSSSSAAAAAAVGPSTSSNSKQNMTYIHVEQVDQIGKSPAEIMKGLVSLYNIPQDKEMLLFTHVRLAYHFSNYRNLLLCVQARLQALSVLVYANALQDSAHTMLHNGLLEELVELIELKLPFLVEIRSAALRTLTSIIHLDRNPHFPKKPGSRLNNIIDVTGASQYHGFLPVLVRNCIASLTSQTSTPADASASTKPTATADLPLPLESSAASAGSAEPAETMDCSTTVDEPSPSPTAANITSPTEETNARCIGRGGIAALAANGNNNKFPLPLATALFSFLYHLASYESGGDALVSCGMMESLLHVINWHGVELEHITFVTRAVRVIDLITNIDMQAFYNHGGLQSFINRLDAEVSLCVKEHIYDFRAVATSDIFDIPTPKVQSPRRDDEPDPDDQVPSPSASEASSSSSSARSSRASSTAGQEQDQDDPDADDDEEIDDEPVSEFRAGLAGNGKGDLVYEFCFNKHNVGRTCLPQRAALLKSMLNFLKKALQDNTFAEHIRHLMEGSLPQSLKHIISNAEYYGPSLFLLATDIVTVYVFQEPSLLSTIQDNGLTDVVLQADVPPTREVLASLPNVFSALCLNARGLASFIRSRPFEKLFKVLLSPTYLSAMRKRRSSDPLGDAATNLGNAMDELMRHQPSLKVDATTAIIQLLEELCDLGTDPRYVCWRPHSKAQSDLSPSSSTSGVRQPAANDGENSSDDEDDDEEEASTSSQTAQSSDPPPPPPQPAHHRCQHHGAGGSSSTDGSSSSTAEGAGSTVTGVPVAKIPIALTEYILNVTKFIDAVLSNNSTDDHCREFVGQGGLVPLLRVLGLSNLPVDCPVTNSAQAVASVCKSILNLAHEPKVLEQGLSQLSEVLVRLAPLRLNAGNHGNGSKLLHELAQAPHLETAFTSATATPLLHAMSAAHGYVIMFVHVCRTGQNDIRTLSLQHWGHDEGMLVLQGLADLYTALVWESTLLLALCSDDVIPSDCDFGREDMERLSAAQQQQTAAAAAAAADSAEAGTASAAPAATAPMDVDSDTESRSLNSSGASTVTWGPWGTVKPTLQQLKYIKPLLGASSRLGRALAELFGLLVKLCVGSPMRQRRGQGIVSAPTAPSPHAQKVAIALNRLLANGLDSHKLPRSPVPKFRLTFLICSVGFTSPMLFDEKRYPYHLMLQKFVYFGGQKTFFETFKWALSADGQLPLENGLEHPDLPEGTGEFLDAWLSLLEKMVNPKAILDSPHVISSKSAVFKAISFDPLNYLIQIHKLAFEAILYLWGRKPLASYGTRMTDSILTILRHILRGEKTIKERLNKNGEDGKGEASGSVKSTTSGATAGAASAGSGSGDGAESAAAAAGGAAETEVSAENLRRLMDMGFLREHATEALVHSVNLEQATDYLLQNPFPSLRARLTGDVEMSEDDQVIQAIAMSLGEPVPSSTGTTSAGEATSQNPPTQQQPTLEASDTVVPSLFGATTPFRTVGTAEPSPSKPSKETTGFMTLASSSSTATPQHQGQDPDDLTPLSEASIDRFTDDALKVCLGLVEAMPDTVFKVCDLLVTIMKRNGRRFRDSLLEQLLADINTAMDELLSHNAAVEPDMYCGACEAALRLGHYVHLFTLFFEVPSYFDMRGPCGVAVVRSGLIPKLIQLVCAAEVIMLTQQPPAVVPRWLTPCLLLLDSIGKVSEATRRKRLMHLATKRIWKWYDSVSGKWTTYSPTNNKLINEAYWSGDQTVRITCGRRRYTISFATMQQINEESNNNRPISMTPINADVPLESGPEVYEAMERDVAELTEREERRCVVIKGFTDEQAKEMVEACVALMAAEIDRDALHAMMRLCLRLTQKFEIAQAFVRMGGVTRLIIMREPLAFNGYRTLATLLIRHTIEGPTTLAYAIKKVIRDRLLGSFHPPYKEMLFVIRSICSAVTRDPDTFFEVSKEIMRIDINNVRRTDDVDTRLPLKMEPSTCKNTTTHVIKETESIKVIHQLLEALVLPIETSAPSNAASSSAAEDSGGESSSTSVSTQTISTQTQTRSTDVLVAAATTASDLVETSPPAGMDTTGSTDVKPAATTTPPPKRILAKQAILKILADAVVSYAGVAQLITEYTYKARPGDCITEDCSCLAFLFDKIVPVAEPFSDCECSTVARTLIAGIASCNHAPDVQGVLVAEVKAALVRALLLPESAEKHARLQYVTGIILSMIEQCPPVQQVRIVKSQTFNVNVNNIARLMLRNRIFSDLAKVAHCLDMSSPNFPITMNSAMKPMECLSRIVNQPITGNITGNVTKKRQRDNLDVDDQPSGNTTSSADATNAQGEETVEDTDNTEHDLSGVASSLEGNTIGTTGNVLQEIMERMFEPDQNGGAGPMDIDDDPSHYDHEADVTVEETITGSSDSEDEVDDDDDDNDEDNEVNENDEEVEEEEEDIDEEDDDAENDATNFGEEYDNGREEDIVMIQYADHDSENTNELPRVRWNENGFAIPIFEEGGLGIGIGTTAGGGGGGGASGSSGEIGTPALHPLLVSRSAGNSGNAGSGDGASGSAAAAGAGNGLVGGGAGGGNGGGGAGGAGTGAGARAQRAGRARRYQYLQLNARNANPPVILQRLLGPSGTQNLHIGPAGGLRDSARVVVMDNFSIFPSTSSSTGIGAIGAIGGIGAIDETFEIGDQGHEPYFYGRPSTIEINHVTIVLHWWQEESRFVDAEASAHDVVTHIANKLIPNLLKHRNAELLERKRKQEAEEKTKAAQAQQPQQQQATQQQRAQLFIPPPTNPATAATPTDTPATDEGVTPYVSMASTPNLRQDETIEDMDGTPLSSGSESSVIFQSERTATNSNNSRTLGSLDDNAVRTEMLFSEPMPEDMMTISGSSSQPATESAGTTAAAEGATATTRLEQAPTDEQIQVAHINLRDFQSRFSLLTPRLIPPFYVEDSQGQQDDEAPAAAVTTSAAAVNLALDLNLLDSPDLDDPDTPPDAIPMQDVDVSAVEEQAVEQPSAPPADSAMAAVGVGAAASGAVVRVRTAVDGEEIPEGVDPSFLEALPADMRREVLEQHRLLRLQHQVHINSAAWQPVAVAGDARAQRPPGPDGAPSTDPTNVAASGVASGEASSQAASEPQAQASGSQSVQPTIVLNEVNPEFLAALPPSLQEEVLIQQRLEQQRQAAARANPDEPVDAGAFFETLQPSLRAMILSDMEDSQMSALPPDLAAEAQTLRRDWEARNRQMVQERFFQSNLTTIIRHSTRSRLSSRFNTHLLPQWAQRGGSDAAFNSAIGAVAGLGAAGNMKIRGRQLLDHEALSCLLVLLFVDDPKLNTARLHRVLRNLCYHVPTRDWVVRALLSIIERSVHVKPDEVTAKPKRTPKPGPLTSKLITDTKNMGNGANWLNIRMEAALGCHANVFIVNRPPGKRSSDKQNTATVTIHPQAARIVCRNALDLFTSLSRTFPSFLLPLRSKPNRVAVEAPPVVKPNPEQAAAAAAAASTSQRPGGTTKNESTDFWDMLLRLDAASTKKGKSLAKLHSTMNMSTDVELITMTFEQSAFGQLLGMLSAPVIRQSVQLTDKLLRLLSVISTGMPELLKTPAGASSSGLGISANGTAAASSSGTAAADSVESKNALHNYESVGATELALTLAVNVLTYKSCSEDGLEEVTTLLINLSNCSLDMSRSILVLLFTGARRIGEIVRGQIQDMLDELCSVHKTQKQQKSSALVADEPTPGTSKGILSDRFTKESVVVVASAKAKATCDLQLPSMAPLTSKSSSQVFFLRVLRVIVQIRDAIEKCMEKEKAALAKSAEAANNSGSSNANTSAATPAAGEDTGTPIPSSNAAPPPSPVPSTSAAGAGAGPTPSSNSPSTDSLSSQLTQLEALWETLSQCLLELEHTPDHHAVLVLQPAVEAFFLVHSPQQQQPRTPANNTTANNVMADPDTASAGAIADSDPIALAPSPQPSTSATAPAGAQTQTQTHDHLKFLSFAEKHRTVLNQILRQTTAHLADGPFSVLVDHTRVLDFDIKRRYFRTELERMDQNLRREETAVHVRREHIFEDSFRELYRRSPEEWKNRFYIVFEDEEGQDAGGLLREWYVIISRDIFNPMYALFTVSPGDRVTYMINSASHYNPNHLCYYKFVGRVIAKAIYDNKLLECYFTRSFYKHILGISVKYTDMESEDYSFYRGLVYLMENNINNLGCDLTFSTEINEFGVTETRDLIENGRNVSVTEENKMEYVRRSCQMKMTGAIRQQLTAFLEGFYDIIPKRLISIFNEQELELLISGLPNVDIDDLRGNTEYHKYQINSLQIQWFWRALRSFDQADRAKFLQFVTGTSKVPLQGFGALEGMNGVQKFQIHRDDRSTDRLPSAHTCFNQLDLPVYETYDKLRSYLLKAIHECSEGFGFA